jgi:hypothetical protein
MGGENKMQFPVQQFPVATPGQMNPFNQAIQSGLDTYSKVTKAKYLPETLKADIASKMTYSNLMGPQFIAKLMGNPNLLDNIPEDQKLPYLQKLLQSGMGQAGLGQGGMGQAGNPNPGSQQNNQQESWADKLRNMFAGGGQQQNAPQQNASQGPMGNTPAQNQYDNSQQNAQNQPMPQQNAPQQNPRYQAPSNEFAQPKKTFSENTGYEQGVREEGKESGKFRAQDIKDLGETVKNATNQQDTYNNISKIITSPVFENMRRTPLAGKQELAYFSKEGTKQQQQMVGSFYTLTQDAIAKASRTFAGQFRKGEQQLLEQMKVGPADTVDTAKGKLQSLMTMNKILMDRSRLTANIMEKQHVNMATATDMANRQLNVDKIEKDMFGQLNPNVTIKNSKTGEVLTVSIDEARKRGMDV